MFVLTARDFLLQRAFHRRNPLRGVGLFCPLGVGSDFVHLEGFLFTLEFLLLAVIVVKFFSGLVQPREIDVEFRLVAGLNPYSAEQGGIFLPVANLLRVFIFRRSFLYYPAGHQDLNLLAGRILDLLFQPYNQQLWLIRVFESFFPHLEETAREHLADAELDNE